ncbi:MAG: GNAT family N-acetyltransferase [Fimbriimonadaceae bacterium]|nr:GNAT family N-acetyltransferase [Fimbriimonadaceae bacterium]
MPWALRPAKLTDVPELGRIHIQCWDETYRGWVPDEEIDRHTAESRSGAWARAVGAGDWVLVAERDGRVVGFVHAGPARKNQPGHPGQLHSIYLLKEVQGLGIGQAMFEAARRHLTEGGLTPFFCYFHPDNPVAGFYLRNGGVRIEAAELADDNPGDVCEGCFSFS